MRVCEVIIQVKMDVVGNGNERIRDADGNEGSSVREFLLGKRGPKGLMELPCG